MLELGCSRTLFKEVLDNIDINEEDKRILEDKFIKEMPIKELENKYYLSRPSVYYRLARARNKLNKRCQDLPSNIRQKLDNFNKIL